MAEPGLLKRSSLGLPNIQESATQSSVSSTKDEPVNEDDPKESFSLGKRGRLIFFTLAVLTLMAALDGTSISVALPIISRHLKGTAIEAFWSGTSFLLCSTVFQPNFASFSNIFGRRPLVITALLFFFVGTAVACASKNFTYMLVGRSIQGVGGGGIIAMSEVIVTDIVPLRLRGEYFGILAAMWSLGSVTGPIMGGAFSQKDHWRGIFYINFPFIGVGLVFVILFLKFKLAPSSLGEKLRQIDYIGTVIFVGSISSFLIPLTWGGVLYPWESWRTLVPLIIGAVGIMVFSIYEYRFAKDPIIPYKIFQNRTTTVSFVGCFLQGLVLWCALYYLPLYYEAVKEYSPVVSGVALFPESLTVAPSSIAVGYLCTKYGRYRWAIWAGWALSTLGMGLICLVRPDSSIPAWMFLNIVPGLGLGFLFPSLEFAVQASTTNENLAIAVAMFSFFRALGQAIGVAVGGVVFQNRMYSNLLRYPGLAPMADKYSQDAAGLVHVIKSMPAGVEKLQLKVAFTDSLGTVWAVCCGLSGIALIVSLLTESYDLDRPLESKQGIATEKGASDEELMRRQTNHTNQTNQHTESGYELNDL